ncbi:GatB/YqeY domain-containing protein, partial [bacterium]|nr:GatB/YqeY domain-containing protein [bacterium]
MELKAKLQNDIKDAMRAKDSVRLVALRMLIAEIKKREIDKKAELDDAEIVKVIGSLLKQRLDSIDAFKKANRQDLVENEEKEV